MKILKFPLMKVGEKGKNTAEIYNTKIYDFCKALYKSQKLGQLCFLLKKVLDQKEEQQEKTINLTQEELQALLQQYAKEILNEFKRQIRTGNIR